MEYNTKRGKLTIREYGRNVQKLVENAKKIADQEKRNDFALSIIDLMGQLNPHLKNVEDFKTNLWTHLQVISNHNLDVSAPYEVPNKEELVKKPKHIGYPQERLLHRNYGKNILKMIDKAMAIKDAEKKKAYAFVIANYMKVIHADSMNDDIIINDLKRLSRGKLVLDEATTKLTNVRRTNPSNKTNNNKRKRNNNQKNNNKRRQHKRQGPSL